MLTCARHHHANLLLCMSDLQHADGGARCACPQADDQARSLAFSAASVRRALDGMGTVRWSDSQPGFSTVHALYAGRTGVCGNGLCEARSLSKSSLHAAVSSAGCL
jgi:hypothetical protein